jgi:uncharacterized membrane protein YfcA
VALGAFFLAMIPARRWLSARNFKLQRWHLALIGLVIGFLTGIVVTTGPLSVPVFLAYGLVKGAFLATEAAGSLGIYVAKSAVFRSFGALPWDAIAKGLVIGASLMAGSYLAKRFVLKLPAERFRLLMDGMMARRASRCCGRPSRRRPRPMGARDCRIAARTRQFAHYRRKWT